MVYLVKKSCNPTQLSLRSWNIVNYVDSRTGGRNGGDTSQSRLPLNLWHHLRPAYFPYPTLSTAFIGFLVCLFLIKWARDTLLHTRPSRPPSLRPSSALFALSSRRPLARPRRPRPPARSTATRTPNHAQSPSLRPLLCSGRQDGRSST